MCENNSLKREITLEDIELARRISHNLYPGIHENHPLYNECESAAMLGLVDAATKFDPEQDKTWPYYRYVRITGSVIDAMRKERDQCYAGLTGRGRNSDEETQVVLSHDLETPMHVNRVPTALPDAEDLLLKGELLTQAFKYIDSCKPREAYILISVWMYDIPTITIAEQLGEKQRYVQWILTKHKPKILEYMESL
jgi:RNA polymerase sigma factor (sigma-70 family)